MGKRNEVAREKPQGVEYAGPSGIARESVWLTHEDLVEGRDVTVTIEKVLRYKNLTFDEGRAKQNAIGLKFEGKDRVLLLNATNRKVLNAMHSTLTQAWKGKSIVLFITETEAFGDIVKCIRIRKQGARAATVAEQFLNDNDGVQLPPTNGVDDPAVREQLLLDDDGAGESPAQ